MVADLEKGLTKSSSSYNFVELDYCFYYSYEVTLPLGVNPDFARYRMNHTIARANAR
jgi:hypothetical protein